MLVTQVAVLADAPRNFLQIFFIESILSTPPYTEVAAARSSGSLLITSLVYTWSNHLHTYAVLLLGVTDRLTWHKETSSFPLVLDKQGEAVQASLDCS